MAPYKNYKLGQEGVDVDSGGLIDSPYTLLKAQNAMLDPLGIAGALKKRPGLVKFSAALAGSALGGISVPLSSFVDTRTLYLAQQDGSSVEKWFTSADLFATSGVQDTVVGAWQDPTVYFSGAAGLSRMGVFADGKLFYASADYTSGTTSPVIRSYNGHEDHEFSKIIPATTLGIAGMFVAKGVVYVLTLDSGTTDANFVGRVFSMDTTNGHLTQIGVALTTGHVPVSLAMYNDRLFIGTARVTVTNEAAIYSINPIDETTWTTDLSASADDYVITSIASFKGLLYATTKNGGAATKGKILQRSLAGVWSTVDSTTNNSGTYDGSAVFGGALYVSSRSYATTTTTAVIRKSTDGSSWSTVANSSATAGFGHLAVIGLRLFSQFGTAIQHTTDGAAWTSATPGGGGNVDGALGILIAGAEAGFSNPNTTPSGLGTNDSQTGVTTTTTTSSSSNLSFSQLQSLLGTSPMQSVSIVLTDAQWRALSSVPINILPALAATQMYLLWRHTVTVDVASTFSTSQGLGVVYTGKATQQVSGLCSPGENVGTGIRISYSVNGTAINSSMATVGASGGVDLTGNAVLTGGSSVGGFYVTVWYTIVSVAP